ncbi:hypothetical protein D3C77_583860 [compost metagenome]
MASCGVRAAGRVAFLAALSVPALAGRRGVGAALGLSLSLSLPLVRGIRLRSLSTLSGWACSTS